MTEALWEQVRAVVLARMTRWGWHPEWDDLCQEALIAAWKAVEKGRYRHRVTTVAWLAAGYGAIEYLRSSRALYPQPRRGKTGRPANVSLEAMQEEWEEEHRGRAPETADFTAATDVRIDMERLLEGCSQREQEVLRRSCYDQETDAEIGRAMGISLGRVGQLRAAARARCCRAAGVPVPRLRRTRRDR